MWKISVLNLSNNWRISKIKWISWGWGIEYFQLRLKPRKFPWNRLSERMLSWPKLLCRKNLFLVKEQWKIWKDLEFFHLQKDWGKLKVYSSILIQLQQQRKFQEWVSNCFKRTNIQMPICVRFTKNVWNVPLNIWGKWTKAKIFNQVSI